MSSPHSSMPAPLPSAPATGPFVGVCDIGGTNLRVALADRAGRLLAKKSAPHVTLDAAAVIETLASDLDGLAQEYNVVLRGIGAAVPGPLDAVRGWIHFSPNLGWRDLAFTRALSERTSLPVALDDDANCSALGEQWLGAGAVSQTNPTPVKAARDFVYVIVGTGIGGGLILDGKIYRGAGGGAGEIGHTTIVPDGPLCSCGNYGCLEALAAGPALARRAHELGAPANVSAREVIAASRAGDAKMRAIVARAGRYLGIGLANLVNLLNPEVIAVGGGVALDAGELLLAPARAEMQKRAFASSAAAVRVLLAQLGEDAGLIGAARLIWERLAE